MDPSQIRGAEYVIITHRDFADAARRLAAWRSSRQGMSAVVVEVEAVYDRFSGGLVDPAALRNFLAWALQNWQPAPLFVLLLGDGTYDYKNNSNTSRGNWIPPFEDGDSTYDEWYVRVLGQDVFPDMAIGRIPVQTAAAAQVVVEKLIDYESKPLYGPWRNRALVVADDVHHPRFPNRNERYFLDDAERLAAEGLPPDVDVVKHYLANFPLRGLTKPEAAEEFIGLFNQGVLILSLSRPRQPRRACPRADVCPFQGRGPDRQRRPLALCLCRRLSSGPLRRPG